MSAVHQFVLSQRAKALSEGIKIVRDVLKTNLFPNGFTTLQLFQLAVQQPPPPDFPTYHHTCRPPVIKPDKDRYRKKKPLMPWAPSHPEHPIRSVRFLKVEVLPVLADSFEIKKVRQPRETPLDNTEKRVKGTDPNFEFVWKVVDPSEAPPPPRFKPNKEVKKKVNVNPDYEHSDVRRQNSSLRETTRRVDAMEHSWKRKQTMPWDRNTSIGETTRESEVDAMQYNSRRNQTTPRHWNSSVGGTTREVNAMENGWSRNQTTPRDRNIGETTRVVERMDHVWRRKQPEWSPRGQQNIGKTTRDDETMRYAWRREE